MKKRKCSAAQLAALARGRKKRKASIGGKKTTKKQTAKKKSTSDNIFILGEKTMKTRKKRSTGTKKRTVSKRHVSRSYCGFSFKKSNSVILDGALMTAAAIGSSAIANKLPIANDKLKAAVPAILGVIAMVFLAKKMPQLKPIGSGMLVAGGLSLVRKLTPIPLAGEDEGIALLPYEEQDNSALGVPIEDTEYMGLPFVAGDGYVSAADVI